MSMHKIILSGGRKVGKGALMYQFVNNIFAENYDPSVEDSCRKQIPIDGETCILDLLEKPPHEYSSMLSNEYVNVGEGFLLIYSITSRLSFEEISSLREQIQRVKDVDRFPLILIGNKCDLNDERQVTTEEGQNLAQSFGCPFLETSAKTPINVDLAFQDIIREIRRFNQMERLSSLESKKDKKDCLIM